jgi:hypothetical protein
MAASAGPIASDRARRDLLAGVSGLVFTGLYLTILLVLTRPLAPEYPSAAQVHGYLSDNTAKIFASAVLWGVAGLFWISFLSGLRGVLRTAEGRTSRLSTAAFAGGILWLAMAWTAAPVEVGLATRLERGTDPSLYIALQDVAHWFVVYGFIGIAVLAGATFLLVRRTRILPAWLAWISMVTALTSLLFDLASPVGFLMFAVWMLAASVGLMTSLRTPEATDETRMAGEFAHQ